MDVSEQELVSRVTQGDRAALGELLERYQGRVFNIALRMVHHREDAAELTQDAMLKVIEHIGEFHGRSKLSTWMIRIAMNLCISHLRKRRLRLTTSLDQGRPGGGNGDQSVALRDMIADDREPGPLDRVQRDEGLAMLREAIAQLPEDHRAILVLRDIDEMDYREIGEVLGLATGTVKSRLFRARLALRGQVQSLTQRDDNVPDGSAPNATGKGAADG